MSARNGPHNGERRPADGPDGTPEDHQGSGINLIVAPGRSAGLDRYAVAVARAEQIRTAVKGLGVMLEEAHAAKDWATLGYSSWSAYLKGEFGISRSRGYQLLDHEQFLRELGPSTNVDTSELPEGLTRRLRGWSDELRFRLAVGARRDGEDDRSFSRRTAQKLIDDIEAAPQLVEVLNAREDLRPVTLPLFDFAYHWAIPGELRRQLHALDELLAADGEFKAFLAGWSPHLTTVPEIVHRMGYDDADEARLDAFLLQADAS